jgi:biotin carboxylase
VSRPRYLVFVESNTTGTGRLFAVAARRLGLRPVLLAADPDRYAADLDCYDEVATAATSDRDAVAAWCREFGTERSARIAGVASSSEYFIGVAAEVAGFLGLPHPEPDAVARCRNKADTRAHLSAAGVPIPGWALCRNVGDVGRAADRLGWPVVIKPVDGSGSVGVRLVHTPEQAQRVAAALLAGGANERGLARLPGVLVEAYVAGPELSVEIWNGRAVTAVRKHLGAEPYFVETGHDVPAPLSSVDISWVCHAAERAVVALGMTWGPAHVELRLAEVPKIIEVNPRLAGGNIPRLVERSTGIDLIGLHVAQAAGLPVEPPRHTRAGAAAIRFLTFPAPGRVTAVPGPPAVRDPRVVEVVCRLIPGQEYRPAGDFTDRVGHVLVVAEDPEEAAAVADAEIARLSRRCHLVVDAALGEAA